eukprot:scaffold138812_cov21-Tisochrysis_lutea.AAC.2
MELEAPIHERVEQVHMIRAHAGGRSAGPAWHTIASTYRTWRVHARMYCNDGGAWAERMCWEKKREKKKRLRKPGPAACIKESADHTTSSVRRSLGYTAMQLCNYAAMQLWSAPHTISGVSRTVD